MTESEKNTLNSFAIQISRELGGLSSSIKSVERKVDKIESKPEALKSWKFWVTMITVFVVPAVLGTASVLATLESNHRELMIHKDEITHLKKKLEEFHPH